MAVLSNYLSTQLVNHIFRSGTFSKPSTIAVALCTAAPTPSDTGATIPEVTNAGGYARTAVPPSNTNWNAGTSTQNSAPIVFPTATAFWGTITYIAILDNTTYGAGNLLFFGQLTTPIIVNSGFTLEIDTSALNIQLDA